MFDFITRRRLVFSTVAFLLVSFSFIFVTQFRSTTDLHRLSLEDTTNASLTNGQVSTCYLTEPIDVITLCEACSSYERRSKAVACASTGYRQLVLCSKSNIKTYQSCPVPDYVHKRHFWLFETLVFFVALSSITSVRLRQKTLEKQLVDKIKRQIGESDG